MSKESSFTIICDNCGARDVSISGGYDGDYFIWCNQCDNADSAHDGIKINEKGRDGLMKLLYAEIRLTNEQSDRLTQIEKFRGKCAEELTEELLVNYIKEFTEDLEITE